MTERGDRTPPGSGSEPVGSLGEEAAKLLAALSGWAREHGPEYAGSAAGAGAAVSEAMHALNDHVATGAEECRYCPVCQLIQLARATSPEVKGHLAVAANSLVQAAASLLATHAPDPGKPPVQKIDLDDDGPDWTDDA